MGWVWGRFLYVWTSPVGPPPLPEPTPFNKWVFLTPKLALLSPASPVPLCHFRANIKALKPNPKMNINPKMNKNNYSINFIFFYMANKIILNKFISRLNNAMLAFNFFFKKNKNLFLVFKGENKIKFEQKKKSYAPPKKS